MQHFQKPRAGIELNDLGPNLSCELHNSKTLTDFPNPDLFDRFAHSGHRILTLPFAPLLSAQHKHYTTTASAGSL